MAGADRHTIDCFTETCGRTRHGSGISEAAVGAAEVAQTIVGVRTTAEKSGAASRDLLDRMSHLAKQSQALEQKVSAFVGTIRAA